MDEEKNTEQPGNDIDDSGKVIHIPNTGGETHDSHAQQDIPQMPYEQDIDDKPHMSEIAPMDDTPRNDVSGTDTREIRNRHQEMKIENDNIGNSMADRHMMPENIKRDGNRAGMATMVAVRARTGFFLAVGWILAIASLFIFPYFLFGLAGVIMGVLATKGGSKGGVAVIVANILMMAIGLVFGGVILNYLTRFLGI